MMIIIFTHLHNFNTFTLLQRIHILDNNYSHVATVPANTVAVFSGDHPKQYC